MSMYMYVYLTLITYLSYAISRGTPSAQKDLPSQCVACKQSSVTPKDGENSERTFSSDIPIRIGHHTIQRNNVPVHWWAVSCRPPQGPAAGLPSVLLRTPRLSSSGLAAPHKVRYRVQSGHRPAAAQGPARFRRCASLPPGGEDEMAALGEPVRLERGECGRGPDGRCCRSVLRAAAKPLARLGPVRQPRPVPSPWAASPVGRPPPLAGLRPRGSSSRAALPACRRSGATPLRRAQLQLL